MNDIVKAGHLFPIRSVPLQLNNSLKAVSDQRGQSNEFKDMLDAKMLKFSRHAESRMEQRGITLQPESMMKIMNAVEEAASKGAKDSLIVYRDIAMIVNVPSRTVVTAMEGKQMKSNVFTQIDSAVILS